MFKWIHSFVRTRKRLEAEIVWLNKELSRAIDQRGLVSTAAYMNQQRSIAELWRRMDSAFMDMNIAVRQSVRDELSKAGYTPFTDLNG